LIALSLKVLRFLLFVVYLLICLYAGAALYFCAPFGGALRAVLAGAFLVITIGSLFFYREWKLRLQISGPLILAVSIWLATIQPKLDAPWAPDVAVLPHVELNGDLLTVQHIRNFHYRTDSDFDADYYDKVFDLRELRTVDLFLSYWGTEAIAHTIMSFGFATGDFLAISIETRKEIGEQYSAVEGFFPKFELIYVLADERDVVGVRVNQRGETVYLYRLKPTPEQTRKILLDYVRSVERLERHPKFYNALTTNCTTSILPHLRALGPLEFDWSLLANGYLDRWRYRQGVWGFDIPFEEFRKRSLVNEKVKAAGDSADFSALIRKDLPSIKK